MSALHQKIIDTMTLEGLSPLTQKAYLYQIGHQAIQTTFRYLQWIAMMDLKEELSEDLLRPLEATQ
ncbi:hypothetical protein [Marinomonas mediterranea]|jgi:hypothetical protein|uniref:Uncharacterized protein n=1 Tax=Marinomonas mediterranea (strain ATCC 700492 / JCM 21426 / NBRC 103028 / MMB-1) TaxID=717774 RepID=F2K2R1_MARM1|nr:hypothetical protein [Marinomonas mediterranea]ADZ91194.1 hypothetical protein Marme_1945 [Marinomonas mediterranea MMB-1]